MERNSTTTRIHTLNTGQLHEVFKRLAVWLFWYCFSVSVHAFHMESGTVTIPASGGASAPPTFLFQDTFDVTPLLFVMTTDTEGDPAYVRVVNVTISNFTLALVEAPDDAVANTPGTAAMNVDYFAIEPGVHFMPDGDRIAAGTVTTSRIQHGNNVGGSESFEEDVSLLFGSGTVPAVLSEIQTINSEPGMQTGTQSAPWLTPQIRDVQSGSADFALQRSEVDDPIDSPPDDDSDDVVAETIAFAVMDDFASGTFSDNASNTITYESRVSPDNITGWGTCPAASVNFVTVNDANIKVIASKNRADGGDGGWLRRCGLTNNSTAFVIDEDRDNDSERSHTTENAGVFAFSGSFHAELPDLGPTTDDDWMMEVDTAIAPANGVFTTVNFQQVYPQAPVVFVLNDMSNPESAAVRIRNVTESGFEMAVLEPPSSAGFIDPNTSPATTITYMAVEPGFHSFPDGNEIEVGTVDINNYQSKFNMPGGTRAWRNVNLFLNSFSTSPELPTVLTQIQTINNTGGENMPSDPWLTAAVRSVSATTFQVALERAEVNTGSALTSIETVAYLVINSNTNNLGNEFKDNNGTEVTYESVLMNDNVEGVANTCRTEALSVFISPPLVLASQNRRDGGDGGWVRQCSISSVSVGMNIDEDTFTDSDRSHTTESVGVLAFSASFAVDFSNILFLAKEESAWSGVSGEVIDSSNGNHNATAVNGLTTAVATPAIAGNPGTCRYGDYDGNNDYIALPNSFPDLNGSFTAMAWINSNNVAQSGQRVLADDENNGQPGYAISLGDGGSGRVRFFSRGVNPISIDTQSAVINNNQWHHVAAVHNVDSKTRQIYIDGIAVTLNNGSTSAGYSGTWGVAAGQASVGGETNASSEGNANFRFDGLLDEVRVYNTVKNQAQIQEIAARTRPCGLPLVDNYAVVHDGSALTCLTEEITFVARDINGNPVDPGSPVLNISTITDGNAAFANAGTWLSVLNGSGTLSAGAGGSVNYQFPGGENSVTLEYSYPNLQSGSSDNVDFNLSDGTVSEDVNADPVLEVSEEGFIFLSNDGIASSQVIPTQIAGKPSDTAPDSTILTLQAIGADSNNACINPVGTDPITIKLAAECRNPDTCAAQSVQINDPPTSIVTRSDDGLNFPTNVVANFTDVVLTFDTNGEANFSLNYYDVGLMQLHAQYQDPDTGGFIRGSSNNFVVRPFAFAVDIPKDNPAHASTAGGLPFQQSANDIYAGTPFTANVSAVVWDQSVDTDNDGVADGHNNSAPADTLNLTALATTPNFGKESSPEIVTLTSELFLPASGNDPGLSGTNNIVFSSTSAGTGSSNNLVFEEVGIIEIGAVLADSDYLGAGDVFGKSSFVGRFTPKRFVVTSTTPVFGNACTDGANPFTYLGQNFYYSTAPEITIDARSAGDQPVVNYHDEDFFKLSQLDIDRNYTPNVDPLSSWQTVTEQGGITVNNLNNLTPGSLLTLSLVAGDLGDEFGFDKTGLAEPFNADVDLLVPQTALTDADGICKDNDDDGNCEDLNITIDTDTEMRFGRMMVTNVAGSELLPLRMPLSTQYYNNGVFINNVDDDCSDLIEDPNIILNNGITAERDGDIAIGAGSTTATLLNPVSPPDDSLFISGMNELEFSAPLSGNTGYTDIEVDLSDTADGAAMPWLQFDWDGDGNFDNNPRGRATFGIYSRPEEIIYIREPWD